MPPSLRVRLDPAARAELERRYHTTRNAETRTRYQMVLLAAEGHPVIEVARITRRSHVLTVIPDEDVGVGPRRRG
jgi:hypothetical protein